MINVPVRGVFVFDVKFDVGVFVRIAFAVKDLSDMKQVILLVDWMAEIDFRPIFFGRSVALKDRYRNAPFAYELPAGRQAISKMTRDSISSAMPGRQLFRTIPRSLAISASLSTFPGSTSAAVGPSRAVIRGEVVSRHIRPSRIDSLSV